MFEAKVIEDSINKRGHRLTTLQLRYPRIILAELNTHRMLSKNSSSSRAIPIKKLIGQVLEQPFIPCEFGSNKVGMQAGNNLKGIKLYAARMVWVGASKVACGMSYLLHAIGVHKQLANRIIEPWMWTSTVITGTEWDNFFNLRVHPDAQPEIYIIASMIQRAIDSSTPVERNDHLPYISQQERDTLSVEQCMRMSTSRCARVSYLTHEGKEPTVSDDERLYMRLVGSQPIHASPTEHPAIASFYLENEMHKNFRGWVQHRETVEHQHKLQDNIT